MLLEKPLCFYTNAQSKSQVFAFINWMRFLFPRFALSLKPQQAAYKMDTISHSQCPPQAPLQLI